MKTILARSDWGYVAWNGTDELLIVHDNAAKADPPKVRIANVTPGILGVVAFDYYDAAHDRHVELCQIQGKQDEAVRGQPIPKGHLKFLVNDGGGDGDHNMVHVFSITSEGVWARAIRGIGPGNGEPG